MSKPISAITACAAMCHAVNAAYCQSIGDWTQPSWDTAPEEIRQSAITGVYFRLANPDSTPEDSHKSWALQKYADGWVYGPEKSFTEKTHPCLVDYSDLPAAQRSKDSIFLAVIDSFPWHYFEDVSEIEPDEPSPSGSEKTHEPLPISGYVPQNEMNINLVNHNKRSEEAVLRDLDQLRELPHVDQRWLAIGRTQLEQAFMAINRSIFKPERVSLG